MWIISNRDNCKMDNFKCDKKYMKIYETKITVKTESPPERIKVRVRVRLLKDDGGERPRNSGSNRNSS